MEHRYASLLAVFQFFVEDSKRDIGPHENGLEAKIGHRAFFLDRSREHYVGDLRAEDVLDEFLLEMLEEALGGLQLDDEVLLLLRELFALLLLAV